MNSRKETKILRVRFALAILLGFALIAVKPFAAEPKEKITKKAMKEMIAGAKTASDHEAIADYYYAEAAKARANADEHEQMAAWYRQAGEGSKKTPYAPGTIDHCERLVKDYRAAAEELTALANAHRAMAAGISGTPFTPSTNEKNSGKATQQSTSEPKVKEKTPNRAMQEMIVGAKTASDHQAIADYYFTEAAKARAKADEHKKMAAWYRQAGEGTQKNPYAPGTIDHCERLVKNYAATAEELTDLANEHQAKAASIAGTSFTPSNKKKMSEPTKTEEINKRDLKEKATNPAMEEMIAGAKTASDHQTIADYYFAEAGKARAKADEHKQMATWFRQAGEGVKKIPYAPGTIEHCERLAKEYRSSAGELTALAKEHEAIAAKLK